MKLSRSESIFFYILEYMTLFLMGGFIYYGIEILWRGHSHSSMFIVGGICLILIGLINEIFPWDMLFWFQMIIGDIIVLTIEFISGCYLNIYLGLGVWDYSNLPFNLMGQICLPFALLFLPVIAFAIVFDDWIKYILFHGSKPHYRFK